LLFCSVPTHGRKDIEFQSFNKIGIKKLELKNLKFNFTYILTMATVQGTLVEMKKTSIKVARWRLHRPFLPIYITWFKGAQLLIDTLIRGPCK